MENRRKIHLNNILFVPSFQKNLLSILCLEDKGDRVSFIDGKVMVLDKGSNSKNEKIIMIHEGRLYRLLTPLSLALCTLKSAHVSFGIEGLDTY